MTISVIVPVYNTENYLPKCINSILSQTHKDLQIIFIDDGSTDKSGEILDAYQKTDSRIIVKHIENSGVSKARNLGLSIATGDYIAFVDSDDTINPTMYESLLRIAERYNAEIVTSDFIFNGKSVKNSLDENTVYDEEQIKEKVLPQFSYNNSIGVFAFTNKIFSRTLIINNNILFYEGFSYQEDLMFMINVYGNAKSLYYLPETFYQYVPLPTGLYSSYRSNSGEKFIEARKRMLSLIKEYDIENIDYNNFNISFLYNISFFIYRTNNLVKDRKQFNVIIRSVFNDKIVIDCCKELSHTATSFDRRIATAISKGNARIAVLLIRFVHSGKAGKLQRIIARINGNR